MKEAGAPFSRIAAISGSGQQHGSAYLRKGAGVKLISLSGGSDLASQLGPFFTWPNSPIWMDSSTGKQCEALEKALGGPTAVAQITGSRAYERFTGNQIAKLAAASPEKYAETERIALVSALGLAATPAP